MKKELTIIPIPLQRAILEGDVVKHYPSGRFDYGETDLSQYIQDFKDVGIYWQPQQVLLISDEKFIYPQKGGLYYNGENNVAVAGTGNMYSLTAKNIIASYPLLNAIPTISKEDLPRICDVLNKGETTVFAEYSFCETYGYTGSDSSKCDCKDFPCNGKKFPLIKEGHIVLVWDEKQYDCSICEHTQKGKETSSNCYKSATQCTGYKPIENKQPSPVIGEEKPKPNLAYLYAMGVTIGKEYPKEVMQLIQNAYNEGIKQPSNDAVECENLKALVYGKELTTYQRALAINEFEKLINK